jgi:hypothetical protein
MTSPPFFCYKGHVEKQLPMTCPRRPWWRLPLLLALVLAVIIWSRAHNSREVPGQKNAEMPTPIAKSDPRPKVVLSIDYGNGRRTDFAAIGWRDGMTAADLTKAWPNITIKQKGDGESAFVTAIDEVENQGADGKNWMYSVNGQMADRSFAIYKLKPDDHVLWTFGPRQ